jgi:hypothetical protein
MIPNKFLFSKPLGKGKAWMGDIKMYTHTHTDTDTDTHTHESAASAAEYNVCHDTDDVSLSNYN